MMDLTDKELGIICDTVVRLTDIKQRSVPHLCVENFATACMDSLLASLTAHKQGRMVIPISKDTMMPTNIDPRTGLTRYVKQPTP